MPKQGFVALDDIRCHQPNDSENYILNSEMRRSPTNLDRGTKDYPTRSLSPAQRRIHDRRKDTNTKRRKHMAGPQHSHDSEESLNERPSSAYCSAEEYKWRSRTFLPQGENATQVHLC